MTPISPALCALPLGSLSPYEAEEFCHRFQRVLTDVERETNGDLDNWKPKGILGELP